MSFMLTVGFLVVALLLPLGSECCAQSREYTYCCSGNQVELEGCIGWNTSYHSVSVSTLVLMGEAPFFRLAVRAWWRMKPPTISDSRALTGMQDFQGATLIYWYIYIFSSLTQKCCSVFYFYLMHCSSEMKRFWKESREACEKSWVALNREAHSNNPTTIALALCDERALNNTRFLKYAVSLPETAQPLLSVPSCSSECARSTSLVPYSPA